MDNSRDANTSHNNPLSYAAITFAVAVSTLVSGCVVSEGANALLHTGSGTFERINKQRGLERVARDWCLTIRASQVVPIYPLDEDVTPGDVYIVTTPIEKLKSYWNKKGYLPIDHRFGRFQPTGYSKYYPAGQYGVTNNSSLPKLWQFPENTPMQKAPKKPGTTPVGANPTAAETTSATAAADEGFLYTDWPKAPRAGFPSYSFRIRRGESFNGALPVQGVPVMLGALGARDVSGSITLTDAFTYGIDEASLRDDLHAWLNNTDKFKGMPNSDYLSDYGPHPGAKARDFKYLRLVTRVYLVRSVNISMTNLEASDWKVSVGAPKAPASDNTVFDSSKPEDKLLESLHKNLAPHTLDTNVTLTPAPSVTAVSSSSGGQPAAANPAAPAAPAPAAPVDGVPAAPLTTEEKKLAEEEKKLVLQGKKLELKEQEQTLAERRDEIAKREEQLVDAQKRRQQTRGVTEAQQDFNLAVLKRALERSGMKDTYGGFVLPGGTLEMMSATNKSISMKETFTRPLVIGYHALDFAILENGTISSRPVSTFNRVDFGDLPNFTSRRPYNPSEWENNKPR